MSRARRFGPVQRVVAHAAGPLERLEHALGRPGVGLDPRPHHVRPGLGRAVEGDAGGVGPAPAHRQEHPVEHAADGAGPRRILIDKPTQPAHARTPSVDRRESYAGSASSGSARRQRIPGGGVCESTCVQADPHRVRASRPRTDVLSTMIGSQREPIGGAVQEFGAGVAIVSGAVLAALLFRRVAERIFIPAPVVFLVAAAVLSDVFAPLRTVLSPDRCQLGRVRSADGDPVRRWGLARMGSGPLGAGTRCDARRRSNSGGGGRPDPGGSRPARIRLGVVGGGWRRPRAHRPGRGLLGHPRGVG